MNQEKYIAGLRAKSLVETLAVIVLVVIVADWAWGSGNRFFDVSPHPLWIAVLFAAAQYGAGEGLAAAILCSIALLLGNIPERTVSMKGYDYTLYVLKNPLLWITFGFLVGEVAARHIRARRTLSEQNQELQIQADTIVDNYERVRSAKERLEMRIASQMRSTLQAYQAAKEIEKLHPADVLQGIQEIISSVLSPEKFSVWLLSNEGMDTTITYGWREGEAYATHIGPDSELYRQVIGKQQLLQAANPEHARIMGDQGVMVGPLFARETGEIVGMLKLEKLNFADLNLSTIETFRTICEWVAMAFVNARRYQDAKADTVYNPEHNLMTYGYFQRYTDYITALAKRLRFDVNMVVVRLGNASALNTDDRAALARHLGAAVNDVLRAVDLAFDYHKTGEEYSIMLPATNRPGADIVVEKLKRAIAQRVPASNAAEFVFTVQTVHQA